MLTGWPLWPGLLENIPKPNISFRVSWKDSGRQVRPGISSPFHRKGDRAQRGNMEGTSSWVVGPQAGSFLCFSAPPPTVCIERASQMHRALGHLARCSLNRARGGEGSL